MPSEFPHEAKTRSLFSLKCRDKQNTLQSMSVSPESKNVLTSSEETPSLAGSLSPSPVPHRNTNNPRRKDTSEQIRSQMHLFLRYRRQELEGLGIDYFRNPPCAFIPKEQFIEFLDRFVAFNGKGRASYNDILDTCFGKRTPPSRFIAFSDKTKEGFVLPFQFGGVLAPNRMKYHEVYIAEYKEDLEVY